MILGAVLDLAGLQMHVGAPEDERALCGSTAGAWSWAPYCPMCVAILGYVPGQQRPEADLDEQDVDPSPEARLDRLHGELDQLHDDWEQFRRREGLQ